MSGAPPPPEERFMGNIHGLLDVVKDCVETVTSKGFQIISPTLIELAGTVISRYDNKFIIETFINHSYMHWEKIKNREEEFFVVNASEIFSELPLGNVDSFRQLFTLVDKGGKPIINQESRDEMWSMFEALVKVSINYIHENREMNTDGEYAYEFMEHINIKTEAGRWKMKLKAKA